MRPRQVLPRRFYLITRRCVQRQFLLRPDPTTNNAFLYCLIAAAVRCEIDVLLPCAMSRSPPVLRGEPDEGQVPRRERPR